MSSRLLFVCGTVSAALCLSLPAAAHRIHHHGVVTENAAEVAQTRDLNRQQLMAAQAGPAVAQNHASDAAEPVSRAMYQRVPGGNPLHSAAAGGGGPHTASPPIVHN